MTTHAIATMQTASLFAEHTNCKKETIHSLREDVIDMYLNDYSRILTMVENLLVTESCLSEEDAEEIEKKIDSYREMKNSLMDEKIFRIRSRQLFKR